MAQYTGSRSLHGAAALAVLLLAGCAQVPERGVRSSVAEVPVSAPAAVASPVEAVDASMPSVPLRQDAPLRYVVRKGDTLWGVASRYLSAPWLWPEIWFVNDQVRNPHLIYPGDVLTLVWRDGRPLLVREDLDVGHLSPRVRAYPLEQAIPAIPLDVIRDFLRSPRVVSVERLRKAPYVLGFADPHLVVGAGSEVYVKNLPDDGRVQYAGVRLGDKYIDPDTRELLGWEAIPVADLELRRHGQPATLYVVQSYRETRAGDRLIEPDARSFEANFEPRVPEREIAARIISVFDGVSQIGQYQVVTLSRGAAAGVAPGHVLSVFQSGRDARDPYSGRREALPELHAGTVMVFRVEDRVSYALVMDAQREIHLFDRARNPQVGTP